MSRSKASAPRTSGCRRRSGRSCATRVSTAPARLGSDPVTVDVWLDSASRVIRAQRLFDLGVQRGARLLVTTDFAGYGAIVRAASASAPIRTGVVERLNPVAADPLSASVLAALLNGSRHPATPTIEPSTR